MFLTYKERIIKELGRVQEEKMPKLYKVIHQITSEFISEVKPSFKINMDIRMAGILIH